MSQFAAPDSLHIYPILIDKPNAKNQSVFPVHWWRKKSKKLSFRAGGLSNLSPVFSLTQDRQLRWLQIILMFFHSLTHSVTSHSLTHSLTHSCPWPLVRHGPTTSLIHFSLSWAVFRSCAQFYFAVVISASRPILQVFLVLPFFLLSCGFHLSAWCWIHSPRLRMCPIHRRLVCLISSSIGFCCVAHQRSSFRIVFGQ